MCVPVSFDLPVFTVELRGDLGSGEQGLVDLSFRDFSVQYDKSHKYETHIQVGASELSYRTWFMTYYVFPNVLLHPVSEIFCLGFYLALMLSVL
jgi:hypothetical protein